MENKLNKNKNEQEKKALECNFYFLNKTKK